MNERVRNHYLCPELQRIRREKEGGLRCRCLIAHEDLNCVGVVLEDPRRTKGQTYVLHKYFPVTLISDDPEENGKETWGVNKVEGVNLETVFRWIPHPTP